MQEHFAVQLAPVKQSMQEATTRFGCLWNKSIMPLNYVHKINDVTSEKSLRILVGYSNYHHD